MTRDACEASEAMVLNPVSPTLTSAQASRALTQAVWLTADRLRWPAQALADGQQARLYHSRAGRLSIEEGRITGADASMTLTPSREPLPPEIERQGAYLGAALDLALDLAAGDGRGAAGADEADEAARRRWLEQVHVGQSLIAIEDAQGRLQRWSGLQSARALDVLYAAAEADDALGVGVHPAGAQFRLWAPTAAQVALCVYPDAERAAQMVLPMQRDDRTGVWSVQAAGVRRGAYYRYLVDVFVPTLGWVRNAVTDPYAISLSADSRRSYVANLSDASLQPAGWRESRIPDRVKSPTDMVVYELHVRDFSREDDTVPPTLRGKYLAFSLPDSLGMRRLKALSDAGLTDVHLLPIFDLATVPEQGCVVPTVPVAAPDGEAQRAAVTAVAAQDCFNWGYDPWHFSAPEGSLATRADDGAVRIRELRRMVMGLHRAGLRVGMDVVYNHTTASGQQPRSVLDRIVPGYYQRLDVQGRVERSTCCDNTATEHRMMGKLLIDSVMLWAREYKIASFRFDLMAHQPREVMERLQSRLKRALGREVQLIGEGWNFGEVADGARFVQASQLSLNGTSIGTFSDRGRDAVRGGSAGDDAKTSMQRPGFLIPAPAGDAARQDEQRRQADLLRLAMAGTLRDFAFENLDGQVRTGAQMAYGNQPAGYASRPAEVVNYVENHDNQTLFDALVLKLPRTTSIEDRARTQVLALAINAFSQGVAYFHAGGEMLRSKSMDRNSYDSGDWFNRLDWTGRDNGFGLGLPPQADPGGDDEWLRPLLVERSIKPGPAAVDWTRRVFLDLLRIRASTPLFRLTDAGEVQRRLRFYNTGPSQQAGLVVGRLDGRGRPDAVFDRVLYLVNANDAPTSVTVAEESGRAWRLHPAQRGARAADRRVAQGARVDGVTGKFEVPARSAVVFVVER
ncbi:alpha-1,6-glucosidase domain-containing protein [Roseateles amylovorans]|uniref:DUF3372 domain-containing protein n=1 Tax=Roseateles amylovorans TaxID=2978473 RepID=A0ABY6AU84_9BURK|nr:alpha-1,6-glucosidase domain-containing protein [Roseateles amylovorans]UXH76345.1 DUF3372 domain-containing protein [Roseateles amylovorans]